MGNSNIKKKISLKSYLGAFCFAIIFIGSSIFHVGIKAMLCKSLWNIIIVFYAGFVIKTIIKKSSGGMNFVRFIALIIATVFVCKFGIKLVCNIVDLTFDNKYEVITEEYDVYRSRVSRRGKKSGGYDYYLWVNDVELEINSSLYYELNNVVLNDYGLGANKINNVKDKSTIKVVYWKLSKIIDTLEIIE